MIFKVNLIANSLEHSGIGKFCQKTEKVLVTDLSAFKSELSKSAVSNPFAKGADASANYGKTLVQNRIQNPINENEYKEFKESMDWASCKLLENHMTKTYDKINPFNNENIGAVKSQIMEYIKNVDSTHGLKDSLGALVLSDFYTSKDIFKLFKEEKFLMLQNVEYSNKLEKLAEYAKSKNVSFENPTNEIEQKFINIHSDVNKNLKNLIVELTPKSKNPAVQELEKELKSLGIKDVNFSDDFEQGTLIKSAIEDIIKAKNKLPESITITPLLPHNVHGTNIKMPNENSYHIMFPTSNEMKAYDRFNKQEMHLISQEKDFKNAPIEMRSRLIKEMQYESEHRISTNNAKHRVYHEARHGMEKFNIKNQMRQLTDEELSLAESLSKRSIEEPNGKEYSSEAYAKLMNRENLTPEQMKLYMTFDEGILPQF